MDLISKCADLIKSSKNTVVLTGAGMSTESGIPDFRSDKGLYKKVPEEVLSYGYFITYPKEFYEFIKEYFVMINVKPNIGHKVLSKWEQDGLIKHIITQNIDGLHQKAGNESILEVHGTMATATCQNSICAKQYKVNEIIKMQGEFYYCSCGKGLIKPDVVLYDEPVNKINDACRLVRDADLLIVLGTSLTVYPVASLPQFLGSDKYMIIINNTPTQFDNRTNCIPIHNSIGDTLGQIDKIIN